jgi:hypothetical protein
LVKVLAAVNIIYKVNVVHHTLAVRKQQADGYPIVRKVRKEIFYILVQLYLTAFPKLHNGGTRHGFGNRKPARSTLPKTAYLVQVLKSCRGLNSF